MMKASALVAGWVLVLGSVCFAAEEPAVEIPYDGTQAFRGILNELGMKPLSDIKDLTDPQRTILIVLGDTSILNRLPEGLEGFLKAGGAALVATDRFWEWRYGGRIEVHGDVVAADGPDSAYQGLTACPFVKPSQWADRNLYRAARIPDGQAPTLDRIATNRPSFLLLNGFLAGLRSQGVIDSNLGALYFSVGGVVQPNKGKVLILADHSVFINAMMVPPDTHNFDFTYNCMEWLSGDEPRRDRVLFVDDGTIQDKFDVPLLQKIPPLPPLDAFVPAVNQFVSDFQKETHGFHSFLVPDARRHALWVAGLLVVLVVGLSCYGYIWLARARHRTETGLSPLQNALLRHAPEENLIKQRHQTMLAAGNLWEAARLLVRQELPQLAEVKSPRVVAPVGWWARWKTQQQVDRLWRLAGGAVPMTVSPRMFARLPAEIHSLKTALTRGAVQFEVPS